MQGKASKRAPLLERLRRRLGRARRSRDARRRSRAGSTCGEWDPARRALAGQVIVEAPATDRLIGKLDEADRNAIWAALGEDEHQLVRSASSLDRDRLMVAFGVYHEVPAVLAKTGLRPAAPPEEVHAMARGPRAAGGDYYYADLVAASLAEAGIGLTPGTTALDFGSSSGRVVRTLAAAYPEVEWHGCDPIADAIAWAGKNLPSISFVLSPQEPPLPYGDGSFDVVFAISIWSHFGEGAAVRWLEEMWRILAPGGALLLTAAGFHSVGHAAQAGERSAEQTREIVRTLYEREFWYAPEFGETGDHGVVSPEWGSAFFSTDWLLRRCCPPWTLRLFAGGRVEENQDLYVLQRS